MTQPAPDGQPTFAPASVNPPVVYGPRVTRDEQSALDELRAQVRSARTLAVGGVALGLIATALAAFGLSRTSQGAVATPAATVATTAASTAPAPASTIGSPADAGPALASTIVIGTPGKGLPVVDIYEDFQCPACASVERTFGPQVDALVASGKAEVRYHVMSFLDTNLGNDSSVRAANGGFCAHEQGKFMAWHDTLFAAANRPPKEGDGWTDAQLTALAAKAGLDMKVWGACVGSGKNAKLVQDANQLSLASGVNSTPTYKLNGSVLNLNGVVATGGLHKLVEQYS